MLRAQYGVRSHSPQLAWGGASAPGDDSRVPGRHTPDLCHLLLRSLYDQSCGSLDGTVHGGASLARAVGAAARGLGGVLKRHRLVRGGPRARDRCRAAPLAQLHTTASDIFDFIRLRAEPAWNHSICSGLKVCSAWISKAAAPEPGVMRS
eukprot:6178271-Prymnesium_polylepis.1